MASKRKFVVKENICIHRIEEKIKFILVTMAHKVHIYIYSMYISGTMDP